MPTPEELSKQVEELNKKIIPLEKQLCYLLFAGDLSYERGFDQLAPLKQERLRLVSWIEALNNATHPQK